MTVEAFLGNIMRVNYSEIVSGSGDMRKISYKPSFPNGMSVIALDFLEEAKL